MPTDTEKDTLDDLRLRLLDSQEREMTTRAALRRAVRELALMRRLSKFATDGAAMRPAAPGALPRSAALPLLGEPIYNLDVCENRGEYTFIAGWAFHPGESWNARDATVTLLLRHGVATYYAPTGKLLRPDVAAHFAAQPVQASGGAHGLDGVGFAGEILHASLPAGKEWEIALRLECGTMVCEGATGGRLRR